MITLGIDLSAEPAKTAVAAITWGSDTARLTALRHAATDSLIVELAETADKVGIDCPLGWPLTFVQFVARHEAGHILPGEGGSIAARDSLAYRRTDLALRRSGGPNPLSVSSDRIGRAAMRAAGLLAAFPAGDRLDRSGSGRVVEVYPAAALRRWGYDARRYKGNKQLAGLKELSGSFFEATSSWLLMDDQLRSECELSDDAFDAVVAALNARAATLPGGVSVPDPDDVDAARVEGWIAVPMVPLAALNPAVSSELPAFR